MLYKRLITIQKFNEDNDDWETYLENIHANVNKSSKDNEYLKAGSVQSKSYKVFDVRYRPELKVIDGNTQLYRVLFDGRFFNIIDYDDYFENHRTIRLLGVS